MKPDEYDERGEVPSKKKKADMNRHRSMHEFVVFSVVMFLAIIVLCTSAFTITMQQIVRTNKGNELLRMLENERIKLETSVNNEVTIVMKMAESPLIGRYFANPGNIELETMVFEEIASYRGAISESVFWINDKDKLFYMDKNPPYEINPDVPENYWYNRTMYSSRTHNFDINYNPGLGVVKLWIRAPVLNRQRRPIGIVGVGIDVTAFVSRLYEQYRGRATLYFFNAAGEITGARDAGLIINKYHIEKQLGDAGVGIQTRAQRLESGETATYDAPTGKIAIGTVPALGWYSVAFMPDTINDYMTPMTVLFLVMLMVMALIIIMFNVFIAGFLKSLRHTVESLEASSRYKSEFLAMMSHEIRTPMNAILGMAELATREQVMERAQGHMRTVKAAGTNLLALINDILDFSKIESGKLEITPVDYRLSTLVKDVTNIIGVRAVDARLEFRVNVDDSIPTALFGDEVRIRQIMLNILSNAVKYTSKGFVSLDVKWEKVDGETVNLSIEVADSGRGIKQEDIKRLFKDFVQIDLVKNKGIEGTGLGLAITKKLVTAMGGRISVESEYGRGSVFTVLLPQKVSASEDIEDEVAAAHFTTRGALALVVDDVATNLIVAHGLLASYGMKVHTCRSGAEAIEMVKKHSYDLVFMDHMMPEMDGIEAAMRIRNLGRRYEKLPIIAVTANAVTGAREMFMQNGFNGYLSKPIDMQKLNAVLEKWVPKEKQVKLSDEEAAAFESGSGEPVNIMIEGIDVKKGMATVRGRAENYLRVLTVFSKDGHEKAAEIKKALADNNLRLYINYVHAIKSAAANIGAMDLSETAKNMETAAKDGNRPYIEMYNPVLMAHLEAVLHGIERQLWEINGGARHTEVDIIALKTGLARLRQAITTVNIGAIRPSAKDLQQYAGYAAVGAAVEGVLQCTLRGEYDKAVELIDALIASLG
ncbi:MAG: ATP-binding protein [Chitinispirillia bacterium]|nr:ATP-binding protein [Chitinispirillia bacterium]MCL2269085.1 ATP-binding protein [Chitinispirillia bacterium]